MELIADYYLQAESKRMAFYKISLWKFGEMYVVHKESGANHKILDKHDWLFVEKDKADKFLRRKIKEKISHNSKRDRHYRLVG